MMRGVRFRHRSFIVIGVEIHSGLRPSAEPLALRKQKQPVFDNRNNYKEVIFPRPAASSRRLIYQDSAM